jgi:hypothetical protein
MRLLVVLCTALVAAVLVPFAGSASAPKYDRASGDGVRSQRSVGGSTPSFVLDAKSGPSGENPQGTLSMDFGTFEGSAKFTVQVTCLRVSGNSATVAGVVASGQGTDISIGAGFVAIFKDFGVPKGGVSPDQMSGVAWGPDLGEATVQEVCETPFAPGLPEKDWSGLSTRFTNLLSGNVNVTDA